jgi:hypothetical protein
LRDQAKALCLNTEWRIELAAKILERDRGSQFDYLRLAEPGSQLREERIIDTLSG